MTKLPRKVAARKARATHHKADPKVVAEKAHVQRKTAPQVAPSKVRDTRRLGATQFDEEVRDSQVPDTRRALAERSVDQTREVYERSKNALQAALGSWQKSLGAAGQGAMALNQKIIDIAQRNINNGFDLATNLARAKNPAEVMEAHAAYWRKQFDDLSAQRTEVRALSRKVTAGVAERSKRR